MEKLQCNKLIMKQKTGTYSFVVEPYLCDLNGKATLSMLGNFMLKAAATHANDRGFGYDAMMAIEKAWVLSRLNVQINKYPTIYETISVQTWIEDVSKIFTQRCFALINEGGEEIGYGRSVWAAIDIKTRRAVNLAEMDNSILDHIETERQIPLKKMGKIANTTSEPVYLYTPKYSDIDINRHFNSIKYIEHFLDLFEIDVHKNKFVHEFEIAFLSEALPKNKLSFHKEETGDGCFLLELKNSEKDESVCRASVQFCENSTKPANSSR